MSAPWIALALGAGVFAVVFAARAWQAHRAAAAAATADLQRAAQRARDELALVLRFSSQLSDALDTETLKRAIKGELPALIGTEDFWLMAQLKEWTVLVGDPGLAGMPLALLHRTDAWECFPLVVGGRTLGLLGVKQSGRPFSEAERHLIGTAASLMASAVRNVRRLTLAREISMIDWLTRCLTRWHGVDALLREMRRTRRSRHTLCVAMLDLDHFKALNDTHGHLAGDRVLASAGRAIRESLRLSDIACRYGGDEFLIVLPETSLPGAVQAISNLRARIDRILAGVTPPGLHITTSAGVTEVDPSEDHPNEVIRRADLALYEAKRAGRDRVAVSSAPKGEAGVPTFPQTNLPT